MLINVSRQERLASLVGGGMAILAGGILALRRHPLAAFATTLGGAALLGRGATGHCALYQSLGVSLQTDNELRRSQARPIHRTIVINKPKAEVEAYLNYRGDLATAFELGATADGKSTCLKTRLEESPSFTGKLFAAVGLSPSQKLVSNELRNIKALIETGEIATVDGQPTGQRSLVGNLATSAATVVSDKARTFHLPTLLAKPLLTEEVRT